MDKFRYYFKRFQFLIYIAGFIFAFIGSIQVFWGQYTNVIKASFIVLYSVAKLFLFQPLVAFTNPDNPLIYDMAVILAPISTVIGLFSVFDKLFQAVRLKFSHFNQKHLVVMGTNEMATKFMHNAKKQHKILCLANHKTPVSEVDTLQREGILVVTIDYDQEDSYENKKLYQSYKLNESTAIVSFEDEPMNYGYINVIASLHKPYPQVLPIFIQHQNEQLKEVIQIPLDSYPNLDVRYFNLQTLMSFDLMQSSSFSLLSNTGLSQDFSKLNIETKEDLIDAIGKVHLLMIGFGELGQNILNTATNQATINPYQNMEVTLLDRNLRAKFEKFDSRINHLERVADFNLIDLDLNSRLSAKQLQEFNQNSPFTSIIFTLKDTQESLLSLERLARVLPKVPIAIYCESMTEVRPLASALSARFDNLSFFGELNNLLTVQKILNEDNYAKAKSFNAYYNQIAAEFLGWPQSDQSVEEQWLKISNVKKESSLYQTLHQNVKHLILSKISDLPQFNSDSQSVLKSFETKLEGHDVHQQTDMIENDLFMNFLSALEHKRWNNFYYMQDFTYADQTNEVDRVHNCLIDDWDYFFSVRRDKVIYDFLSWLSLKDETSE